MRSITLTLVAVLIAPVGILGAQTTPLSPGARVRITTPSRPHAREVGTLLALPADSIVVRPEGRTDSLAIPVAQVTAIEVSRGVHTQGWRGLGYGFLAGAGLGIVIGLADGDDSEGFIQFTAGEKAMLGGAVLGVAGAIVGGLVGVASRTERWQRMPLGNLPGRVGVVPRRGGLGVSVALRF